LDILYVRFFMNHRIAAFRSSSATSAVSVVFGLFHSLHARSDLFFAHKSLASAIVHEAKRVAVNIKNRSSNFFNKEFVSAAEPVILFYA